MPKQYNGFWNRWLGVEIAVILAAAIYIFFLMPHSDVARNWVANTLGLQGQEPTAPATPARALPWAVADLVAYRAANGLVVYLTFIDQDGLPTIPTQGSAQATLGIKVVRDKVEDEPYADTVFHIYSENRTLKCGEYEVGQGLFQGTKPLCNWGYIPIQIDYTSGGYGEPAVRINYQGHESDISGAGLGVIARVILSYNDEQGQIHYLVPFQKKIDLSAFSE
jgi:hypothetical protein